MAILYLKKPGSVQVESLIDDHLLSHPEITEKPWRVFQPNKNGGTLYAMRTVGKPPKTKRKAIYIHRLVWEIEYGPIPDGMTIDHINHDGLDNRLANLRLASYSEQHANKRRKPSAKRPYKGVTYLDFDRPLRNRWNAIIKPDGQKKVSLGCYAAPEEGAVAYNFATVLIDGEFACPNEIPEGSVSPERQAEIRIMVEERLAVRGLLPETTSA